MQNAKLKKKKRVEKIISLLKREYDVRCPLHHKNPFQLAVAVTLSAQCTDKQVNKVTPMLFRKYPDAKSLAKADPCDIEKLIHSTGFYKNKTKSIQGMAREVLKTHKGKMPQTLEELTKLPGIGRKTANVVLGVAWGIPGIVVDTHVKRLTNRMGFTKQKDPTKIEFEMMKLLPKKDWNDFGLLLIYHGRAVCDARKPDCPHCLLQKICPKVGISFN